MGVRVTDAERLARYGPLKLTPQQEKELLEYDKACEAEEKTEYDLPPDKKKVAQKYCRTGTRKTPTNYKLNPPKRKEDATKREIIAELVKFLGNCNLNLTDLGVENPEKEVRFKVGEKWYSLVLSYRRNLTEGKKKEGQRVLARKNYYLVLDTETATLPFIKEYTEGREDLRKNLAIAKPLVYDIGWTIVDTKGVSIKKVNYLVQETFFVPNVFNTAYYCDKRPKYMEMLKAGVISAKNWNDIIPELVEDAKKCKAVCAYNAAFDFKKAIPFTERYISALYGDYNDFERKQRYSCKKSVERGHVEGKNPKYLNAEWEIRNETFPIIDLWEVACTKLINIDKYRRYCLDNSLWSASTQYFKTSAETAFQYLMSDYDFEESHTALDDAEIEAEILAKALKRGKVDPCMGAFPFMELGTTYEFAMTKYQKSKKKLLDAMHEYYDSCEERGYGMAYMTKIWNMIARLEGVY